jgi:octaprenyl-diphosphate synthase
MPAPGSPCWYDALFAPVRGRVEASWARIPGGVPRPDQVPRAGLGGAVVAQVAQGWGTRRWQEAARVAIPLVEAVNQRVHLGAPTAEERAGLLKAEPGGALALVRRFARRDEAILRRVGARVIGDTPGCAPVPEAVGFLRGAVAAGVIIADVPDEIHAGLDAWARAVGEGIEGDNGDWRARAEAALASVPDADARERMIAVLTPGPDHAPAPRVIAGWDPVILPDAPPPGDPITRAMDELIGGGGPVRTAARWVAARGGKRMRARVALGAACAVGAPPEAALRAGAAIEWVHAASLVLDDIVDEADLRRGAPALHRATSTAFAAGVAGWILSRVVDDSPELTETLISLAVGQRSELARAGDAEMPLSAWYGIAADKTGRLFSAAARLGGAAAGADPRAQAALARYGGELGLAFQIVDDLLDLVGDEAALGKRPGQDLRTGRVTFPLLLLRDREPAALAGTPDALITALHRRGVVDEARARARVHADRACAALAALPGDASELRALAAACVERSA